MLTLMLFRHAHADRPSDVVDHERPLSIQGYEQARRMGKYIAAQRLHPDLVIVSTAKRTQQTLAEAAGSGELSLTKVDEPRVYESSAGDLLEVLRQQDAQHARIMLVGHNPGMERLAAWLIGSGDSGALVRLQREFVVAGLAEISFSVGSWSELDVQSGRLERFETPETV